MMRLKKRVRESLAVELKRLAWSVSTVFALLGWSANSGWLMAGLVLWWLLGQFLAHVLLALEDSDTG